MDDVWGPIQSWSGEVLGGVFNIPPILYFVTAFSYFQVHVPIDFHVLALPKIIGWWVAGANCEPYWLVSLT